MLPHAPTVLAPRRARPGTAAALSGPTASTRPRHHRRMTAAALIALGALTPTAEALAQPARDIVGATARPTTAVARDHHPRATPRVITFTNPLGKSRGPGAGAGLL